MIRRLACAGVCVAVVALGIAPGARAGAGRLDPTYGRGGVTTTGFGVAGEAADAQVTFGAAGSALVANGVEGTAVRFAATGSWDKRFGKAGRLAIALNGALGAPLKDFSPSSITLDGRERVVAFGQLMVPSQSATNQEGLTEVATVAAVLRLAPTGRRLDSSFGEGKGYVEGDFGLPAVSATGLTKATALVGLVDPADRPVFVAASATQVAACEGHSEGGALPEALVRLTESGQPDQTFGAGTGVSPIVGAGNTRNPVLGFAEGDRPVVGVGRFGTYAANCGAGTTVHRFGPSGEPLASFGPDGAREFLTAQIGLVEPSGTLILVEGPGRRTLRLTAIGPEGSSDPSFGGDGVAIVHLPDVAGLDVRIAGVDAKGRVVLAGLQGSKPAKGRPESSFVVARLLPDGRPDRSFGKRGWLFTRLPAGRRLISAQGKLDSKGRLLIGGIVTKPGHPDGAFTIARYLLGP